MIAGQHPSKCQMRPEIRSEEPWEASTIAELIASAFDDAPHTSHTEHFIVNALRRAGQLTISLVAVCDRAISGHVAISPVGISDGTAGWYGLGPVSVAPRCQGKGIGSLLVQHALAHLRQLDAGGCVVLGEPGYYGHFGFKTESALILPDVPPEYFQAIALQGAVPSGTATYHKAFEATE